jgi:hypothetical protein
MRKRKKTSKYFPSLFIIRLFVVVITQVMAINIRKDSFCSAWAKEKKNEMENREKLFTLMHTNTHTHTTPPHT